MTEATALPNDALRVLRLLDLVAVENPTDVTEEMEGVNHRYARELLGLLVTGGYARLVEDPSGDRWVITDPEGVNLAQQTRDMVNSTYRTGHTSKETKMAKNTAPKTKRTPKPKVLKDCGCGCGTQVTGTFAQGHDARMVSQLTVAVVGFGASKRKSTEAVVPPIFDAKSTKFVTSTADIQERINTAADAVKAAFGATLATKFHNAAMNGWARATATPRVSRVRKPKTVTAKVGRWEYEGHVTAEGDFIYTVKGNEKVAPKGKYQLA